MIKKIELLEDVDSTIEKAIKLIDWALGKLYNVTIIAGMVDEKQFEILELQGGKLATLNAARKAVGLYEKSSVSNHKIVKKNWFEDLKSGKGIVFTIETGGHRHKKNRDIETAFEYVSEKVTEIKFDSIENKMFESFMIYIPSVKKKKEESTIEPLTDQENEKKV